MNLFKGDPHNRGLLARPSPRYSNHVAPNAHYQRNLLNGNRYVASEIAGTAPLHEQAYPLAHGYDANYPYPSYEDRFPIDERTEDLKSHNYHRQRSTRTPGYVTSIDTTPSHPMPHSSLSSSGELGDLGSMMYDEYGPPSNGYMNHSPYMQGMAADDLYYGPDWSSDGSSDTTQGRIYGHRHRHRPHVGQRRMTDLGREVFNGIAWVAEEDYLHDAALMPQTMPSPYHGRNY